MFCAPSNNYLQKISKNGKRTKTIYSLEYSRHGNVITIFCVHSDALITSKVKRRNKNPAVKNGKRNAKRKIKWRTDWWSKGKKKNPLLYPWILNDFSNSSEQGRRWKVFLLFSPFSAALVLPKEFRGFVRKNEKKERTTEVVVSNGYHRSTSATTKFSLHWEEKKPLKNFNYYLAIGIL